MKIGLIGLGRIGQFHAQTLSHLPAVDELVLSDPYSATAEDVATKLGASLVSSPQQVLDSGIDGVVVASSTPTHLGLIEDAVRAGIPVFCEKPVTQDPYAAQPVADLIAAGTVPVQIGFPRRFDAAFVQAKSSFDMGELGWLSTIRSTTMDPSPPPAAYIASSGGFFKDCAVHDIDAIRWVSGREVVEVYSVGSNRGDPYIKDAGDVDTTVSVLTLDDGTIALISNTRYNGAGYDVRLELHGSEGSIAAGLDDGYPMRSGTPSITFPAGPPWAFFIDRLAGAFRSSLEAFTKVVAGQQTSPCTFADGLEATWIAEACTRSWREHRPVRLDEVRQGTPHTPIPMHQGS